VKVAEMDAARRPHAARDPAFAHSRHLPPRRHDPKDAAFKQKN